MINYYDNIELGKRILKARKIAGLTQSQLSKLTNISITQISAYENGKRNIGLYSLSKIAQATKKTIDEIYNGSFEDKQIITSKNHAELIVNCISCLVDEGIITKLIAPNYEEIIQSGGNQQYLIWFGDNLLNIADLVDKLLDFKENILNYNDPENYKKLTLDAAANKMRG